MDLFHNLLLGFSVALNTTNLLYCLMGVFIATLIGVLPGIGPVATVSILLPLTFHLPAISALIMLAGIYYGSMYGGSTSAILINLPGEASHVVTSIDGYPLAQKGRAGAALGMAAIASFFGGTVSNVVVALFSPPLAEVAIRFGAVEYFSLMVFGLTTVVILAHGSVLKAVAMVVIGLLIGMIGTDVNSGDLRYTLGLDQLADGISFVVVAIGMFGIAQIISNLEHTGPKRVVTSDVKGLLPTREDFKAAWKSILRGTALGSLLGILPGTGATISAFAAYSVEKRMAADPSRFGQGAIEGIAGPESANNAAAQTHFIPMLVLGIPPGPTLAVLLGAMTMEGIDPGPQVITSHPDLFWGMIASMWIGNLFLVILNLPLIGIWVKILTIPYRILYPTILLLACIGVFSLDNSTFNIILAAVFGLLGFVFRQLECEAAPLMLGLILGPMMEQTLRRALLLSRGDPTIFLTEKISLALLLCAAAALSFSLFSGRSRRDTQRRQRWNLPALDSNGDRLNHLTKVLKSRDFCAGIIFLVVGAAAIFIAQGYNIGQASRMGPGYFPILAGIMLALLGVATIGRAVIVDQSELPAIALRPVICVLGGVLAFAFLLEPAGLAISALVLVVLSRLGGPQFKIVEVLILFAALVLVSWFIFVFWLGLPINLWPG
jgi:putative tricarboxylic transport membrane protein